MNPNPGSEAPTPSFTKPEVPHTQAVGAVTIALTADLPYAPNSALTVKRNGTAVAAPATVQSGNAQIASDNIPIPTTGTGNLVIAAEYFTNLGAGEYTLTITANNNPGLPGSGTANVTFTLAAP
jgi:hypothetical protein